MNAAVVKANIVVFIASFCTLVIELVAGRIMAPYVGVSLYTWTSIIGVVLAGISIGAYLGGIIADRYPRQTTLGWLLFLSGLGAFSISPLTNLIGAAQFQSTLMMRIMILTTVIFFVPSAVLGMISPVVVKLTLDNLEKTGNVVGKIYAFSTLGSIIGTFTTGFYLISWMGTRNILLIIGVILIASALVFGGFFMRRKSLAVFILVFAPLTWALYGVAFKAPLDAKIYYYKESDYYTIKLMKYGANKDGRVLHAMILDNLVHSLNDLEDPRYLDYPYIRIYEEVVHWQEGKRRDLKALFIGGGAYTFPRYMEAEYPRAEIDVVEIDPEITKVTYDCMGLSRDSKIRSFNEDGRWFVMNRKEKEKYDFIFGDAFNDLSIPYHLTTKEFARQLKSIMKPDGLLVANLIDSFREGAFLPSYIRTLEEVFGRGNVHLIALYPDYENIGVSTCVVLASPVKLDMAEFQQKTRQHKGHAAVSNVVPAEWVQKLIRERNTVLLTDDYVPVDNLTAPVFEARYGYKRVTAK
ncbi:MAG: fused MFS/spermidine synthase [Syntrophales bacterium]